MFFRPSVWEPLELVMAWHGPRSAFSLGHSKPSHGHIESFIYAYQLPQFPSKTHRSQVQPIKYNIINIRHKYCEYIGKISPFCYGGLVGSFEKLVWRSGVAMHCLKVSFWLSKSYSEKFTLLFSPQQASQSTRFNWLWRKWINPSSEEEDVRPFRCDITLLGNCHLYIFLQWIIALLTTIIEFLFIDQCPKCKM